MEIAHKLQENVYVAGFYIDTIYALFTSFLISWLRVLRGNLVQFWDQNGLETHF